MRKAVAVAVYGQGLRALACGLLGWQVWLLWFVSSSEAAGVKAACDGNGGCASDQFAAWAPLPGIAGALLLGVLAARFLHRATAGATLAFSALACVAGWYRAVTDGRVDYDTVTDFPLLIPVVHLSVSGWLVFLWAVFGVGALFASRGAAVSLRRTAALHRLSRRYATADATVRDWRRVTGNYGAATLVFEDRDGVRHEVPAVTERLALGRPVLAVYAPDHPDDPRRTRVAIPRGSRTANLAVRLPA
ncbi:hypothetical protein ACIQNU_27900 [Streptomyces sp. NPDC091292]|uniref:hypothetical protein n=1 Tax=Streptomyces sp. NPDC091292 TaxID=3365991 RepID=UPI003811FB14